MLMKYTLTTSDWFLISSCLSFSHTTYSSSQLTLLLTFLSPSRSIPFPPYVIPLPSRLKMVDRNALNLHGEHGCLPQEHLGQHRKIFQGFLDSSDPLALNAQRYATAALAGLKILFGHYHTPVLNFRWFSQHSRILRVGMEPPSNDTIQISQCEQPSGLKLLNSTGTLGLCFPIGCFRKKVLKVET